MQLEVLVVLATIASSSAAVHCTTAADCSLGGKCTNGACICWPLWTGVNCSLLNLLPASPLDNVTDYPAAWARPDTQSSWGGRPIHDDDANDWKLYAADMSLHCGLDSWQRNSVISMASAPTVTGPYKFVKQIQSAFAHNPTVHKHPDGTYVIYHIGNGKPYNGHGNPIKTCTNGTTPHTTTTAAAGRMHSTDNAQGPSLPEIGSLVTPTMLVATSATGPWAPATSASGSSCNNPAAYFYPNGTVVLICKVMSAGSNGIRQMQVSTAPSWQGPYTVRSTPKVYGEDAFIWRANEDGNFHMLLHSMHPTKICTTAWSPDGINWTPAFTANLNTTLGETYPSYSHTFELTNGKTFKAGRRERHQLAFDTDGTPTHLLNGIGDVEGKADFTFTSIQPLNQK